MGSMRDFILTAHIPVGHAPVKSSPPKASEELILTYDRLNKTDLDLLPFDSSILGWSTPRIKIDGSLESVLFRWD